MKSDTGQESCNSKRFCRLTTVLILLIISAWKTAADSVDDIEIFNEKEIRSRILMINGNIYVYAGFGKNITFQTSLTGSINFGNTNIRQIPRVVS
ncbi:unnamed protein product [Enterobius vermicularis]|uniref:Hyphal_reg_CWP domain-containing protein n=1 Tax=Enterobius vermicularis TaxID=51028 RepID=A0A0N4VNK4_ENTVE|nr:unnamed protein product [Enterobius vermicularis]